MYLYVWILSDAHPAWIVAPTQPLPALTSIHWANIKNHVSSFPLKYSVSSSLLPTLSYFCSSSQSCVHCGRMKGFNPVFLNVIPPNTCFSFAFLSKWKFSASQKKSKKYKKIFRKNIKFFSHFFSLFISFGCRVSSNTVTITICHRFVTVDSPTDERVRLCKTRIGVSIEDFVLCIVAADTGTASHLHLTKKKTQHTEHASPECYMDTGLDEMGQLGALLDEEGLAFYGNIVENRLRSVDPCESVCFFGYPTVQFMAQVHWSARYLIYIL